MIQIQRIDKLALELPVPKHANVIRGGRRPGAPRVTSSLRDTSSSGCGSEAAKATSIGPTWRGYGRRSVSCSPRRRAVHPAKVVIQGRLMANPE
jgi:hypothetical protein